MKEFRDLVIDRMMQVTKVTPTDDDEIPRDNDWYDDFVITLTPNPGFDAHGKEHIERQYGMENGELHVPVKKCFVVYFLKRYQLEEESSKKAPHQEPLVVKNREEVTAAIPSHMRIPPES